MTGQHLCVIGADEDRGVVNIAKSSDPQKWLAELQDGNPSKLRLLHVDPEAGRITRWLHEVFAGYRKLGEWFGFPEGKDPVAEVQEAIRAWREEQKHTHDGDSTYFAYVHLSCRHPSCAAAAVEYRERLKDRKRSGDFADLRFKENQEQSSAEDVLRNLVADPETASKLRDLLGMPQALPAPKLAEDEAVAAPESQTESSASTDNPEESASVTDALSDDASRVLKYLMLARIDTRGKINPTMTRVMPTVLGLAPDRCQAALDELERAELLAGDGTDLYLMAA